MAELIWSEPALAQLEEIAEYIDIVNSTAAKQLVRSVFLAVERLIDFPESGRIAPETKALGCREIIVNPCRIFYKFVDGRVNVLFVMRQEQDLRKFILTQ